MSSSSRSHVSSFSFVSFSFWLLFVFVFVPVRCCLHSGSSSSARGLRAVRLLAFLRYSWTWVFESRAIVSARSALLFDFILRGLAQPARSHGVCGTSIDVAVRVDLFALACVVAYYIARLALFSSSLTGAGVARGLVGPCVFDVRRRHACAPPQLDLASAAVAREVQAC